MTASDPRVGEIQALAEKFLVAHAKLIELDGGVGALAMAEPDLYRDWEAWYDLGSNSHADIALELLAELADRDDVITKLSDWAGRSKSAYYDEAQDDVVKIIRPILRTRAARVRAAVAAANGESE